MTTSLDKSTWKLPEGVSFGCHRDEHAKIREEMYAARGVSILHKDKPPAVGQLALVQIMLKEQRGWCILQGRVMRLLAEDRVELDVATMTSSGPEELDRDWYIVLQYYPEFYKNGPWTVVEMRALDADESKSRQLPQAN